MELPAPNQQQISQLLEIASRVPDHKKLAPWRFIVFAGDARSLAGEKLVEILESRQGTLDPKHLEIEFGRFTRAPLVIGVVSAPVAGSTVPVWEQELSAGASCMNLLSAALAMGFAAQWISEWYVFDEEASRTLGVKEGERFAGFIHIGTPSMTPTERPRPDVAEITSYWSGE
ncbi:nitroreductase [Rhodobacteraceae bacterium RKSG542]|uniref:nitroreductase family protein n=1 Tax=Pseudovibrio flavus TaxID=2529854 RepID=UPI0012BC53A6|nr:nitroreductase [Pseudovibrio flavus]MTI19373.1 nitroreductase [Pseudovibrio flavus]